MMRLKVKRGIGPVHLIVLVFIASAATRIGSQGMAIAEVATAIHPATEVAASPPSCDSPPDIAQLLADIKERQNSLADKEREIADRRILLDQVEMQVATELQTLKDAQDKLSATLSIADSAAENDLARLTEVYEKMKPKTAASIFEAMDMSFAAGFLSRMKPAAAAGVLSAMPPERAYSISVVMAGRNALAPTK